MISSNIRSRFDPCFKELDETTQWATFTPDALAAAGRHWKETFPTEVEKHREIDEATRFLLKRYYENANALWAAYREATCESVKDKPLVFDNPNEKVEPNFIAMQIVENISTIAKRLRRGEKVDPYEDCPTVIKNDSRFARQVKVHPLVKNVFPGTNKKRKLSCKVCATQVQWRCIQCEGHPALCRDGMCNIKYHNPRHPRKSDFSQFIENEKLPANNNQDDIEFHLQVDQQWKTTQSTQVNPK